MDLHISVFLLFILFTAGNSLSCYECKDSCEEQNVTSCSIGASYCENSRLVTESGDSIFKQCTPVCHSSSKYNGWLRSMVSCCTTNLCNKENIPDPVPNGKKCNSCVGESCSNTVSCSGDEDHCYTEAHPGDPSGFEKGCASKSYCDVYNITCCEGNLCNGVQRVSQSFLFLCCSLISYFLLH